MKSHAGAYAACWLALVALATLTLWLSTLELGALAVPVALGIAFAKAGLVAAVFMHLPEQSSMSRACLVVGAIFVALIALLIVGDIGMRDPRADSEHDRTPPFDPERRASEK